MTPLPQGEPAPPPAKRRHPFLDGPVPAAFAHRGARLPGRDGMENSMAAFARAVGLGYRYLETDVQATADGALVTFHDPTLDRVTDRCGRIAALPYAQVARARIGGTDPVPLLEEVLHTWPRLRVNVDVKGPGAVPALVRVLRRANALDRVCVASFSDRRLSAVRRALGPGVCTSLGPVGVAALRAVSQRRLPARFAPRDAQCVQVPVGFGPLRVITPRFLTTAHQLGLPVHAWTIDDPAEMNWLLDLGIDGLITDDVDALRSVLLRRGAWQP